MYKQSITNLELLLKANSVSALQSARESIGLKHRAIVTTHPCKFAPLNRKEEKKNKFTLKMAADFWIL